MANKVLILHQGSEFMADSLAGSLRKRGIDAVISAPTDDLLGSNAGECRAIVLFAGDYVANIRCVLTRIRDICASGEAALFVIGYDKDIAEVSQTVPSKLIAGSFTRPFEMKTLVDRLSRVVLSDAPEEPSDKKRSILLVDDDPMYLKTMLKFLSDIYTVTAVRSGAHAMKYLETHSVDMILLDYNMPEMNGPQTLERIRASGKAVGVPVVFLTGISDKESVVTVMQMKPDGYMLKSTGKDELLDSINAFFVSHKWKNI